MIPFPVMSGVIPLVVVAAVAFRAGARKYRVRGQRESGSPLLPEIFLLPTAASLSTVSVNLAVLSTAMLVVFSFKRRRTGGFPGVLPLALLLAASVPVWLRPVDRSSLIAFCIGLLALNVARWAAPQRRAAVVSIIEGAGFFLVINVLTHLAGVHPSTSRLGGAVTSGGPFQQRLSFLLSPSEAVLAAVAAAYLVGVAMLALEARERYAWRLLAASAAVFVLLGANYRAPLALGLALWVVLRARPRLVRKCAPIAGVLLLLLPFVYPQVRRVTDPLAAKVATSVPLLDRTGAADPGGLSGRDLVWSNSLEFWWSVPVVEKVIGFGAGGQQRSGASSTYARLFRGGYANPAAASTHNVALQQLYDAGLVGMGLLVAGIHLVLRRYSRVSGSDALSLAGLASAFILVATAATEVTLAPGSYDVPIWMLLVLAAAIAGAPETGVQTASSNHALGRDRALAR